MNISHYYDVVSMIIDFVSKAFPEGKKVRKNKLSELEFSCRILEEFFDECGTEEFSAEYDENTEDIILYINSGPLHIKPSKESALGVIEKAKSLSFNCSDNGNLQTRIKFELL